MKKYLFALAMAPLLLLVQSCSQSKGDDDTRKEPIISDSLSKMIEVDTVKLAAQMDQLKLSGQVDFDENRIAKVFSNSSGQVMDVKVSFGDRVRKGQVLAIIKSADVAGNYSDRASAEADVKIAKRQLDNARSLYEGGISSQREYEEAKENYGKAAAVLNKINSLISINGKGYTSPGGLYYVTAPTDGFIVEKKITTGSFLRQDMADNLFTISDLKDVWVWANVYETDIAKVREGMQASITTLAYPDRVFSGRIDKVSDLLDPVNKSLRIRVTLPNDSLILKPDMFANVIISSQETGKDVAIPASAVINDNGKAYIVQYFNNNQVKVKEIHPLKTVGAITYINGELQPGDRVISQNQILLYDAIAAK